MNAVGYLTSRALHYRPDIAALKPEQRAAAVAELVAKVGTVCHACSSTVMRRADGSVFCWDPYCGQQSDAYLAAVAS